MLRPPLSQVGGPVLDLCMFTGDIQRDGNMDEIECPRGKPDVEFCSMCGLGLFVPRLAILESAYMGDRLIPFRGSAGHVSVKIDIGMFTVLPAKLIFRQRRRDEVLA